MKCQWLELTPSRDIDYQRILKYDWTRGTTILTQPKVIVSHAPIVTKNGDSLKTQAMFIEISMLC